MTEKNFSKQQVCNILECYISNENIADESEFDLKKKEKNCPYCSFDYKRILAMRRKINAETSKAVKKHVKNARSKIIEYIITVFLGLIFVCSLIYLFTKLYVFSKSEKNDITHEFIESNSEFARTSLN